MIRAALIAALAIAAATISSSRSSYACASCGSGGDDPLILYPNERFKAYLGLSHANVVANINPDGSTASPGGIENKQALTLAGGVGFTPRSFATLTIPMLRNVGSNASRTAIGDASIAGRYTLVMQSIDEPLVPQVQLTYGYKHSYARSLYESRELKTQLDVFGSGFSDVRLGADIWLGMPVIKPGVALHLAKALPAKMHGVSYEPGLVTRATLSVGYMPTDMWRLTVGINRDQRDVVSVDGRELSNTEQLNHSAFVTSDYMFDLQTSLRLSLSRQAALFANANTARIDNFAAAYMFAF